MEAERRGALPQLRARLEDESSTVTRVATRSSLNSLRLSAFCRKRQRDFRVTGRRNPASPFPLFPRRADVSVSGGTFGPPCPASNLTPGLSRRVIATFGDATKLQYYTNSRARVSRRERRAARAVRIESFRSRDRTLQYVGRMMNCRERYLA